MKTVSESDVSSIHIYARPDIQSVITQYETKEPLLSFGEKLSVYKLSADSKNNLEDALKAITPSLKTEKIVVVSSPIFAQPIADRIKKLLPNHQVDYTCVQANEGSWKEDMKFFGYNKFSEEENIVRYAANALNVLSKQLNEIK